MQAATTVDHALEAIRILIWPLTIVTLVLLFRRQVAERVGSIRKAQLPGGISFELDALEREVINTPELDARRTERLTVRASGGVLPTDRAYTVARVRVDLERALRRLLFAVNRDPEFATRNIEDLLLDLRSSGEISAAIARQAQEFLRLSAASFSAPSLSDDDVVAFHTVGSLLASHVSNLQRVASIATGAWGHELMFMIERRHRRDGDGKITWAAIATILPEVDYDYSLFRAAIHRAMDTRDDRNWPKDMAPMFGDLLVSEVDFQTIVVFRRDELRRVIGHFDPFSWFPREKNSTDLEYKWPRDWGEIPFNMPVTRGTLPEVADDLLRAEEAVRQMRLAAIADGSNRPGS